MSISKTTVFSNSWIALAAASSTLLAFLLYQPQLSIETAPLGLLFFSTLARYNIISFTLPDNVTGEKFLFMKKHRKVLKVVFIIAIIISIYFACQLTFAQLLFLSHLALLTLWYIFPLPLGFRTLKPLRKLPFLKIFLIAYVWAGSTYVMPLFQEVPLNSDFALGFIERFLFLFSITIPFDIKDYEDDKRLKLSTIPNVYGIKTAKITASLCLVACLVISSLIYPPSIGIGLISSYLITWPFIWFSSPKKNDLYFLGWIDGTMIWQCCLVYLSSEYLPMLINN